MSDINRIQKTILKKIENKESPTNSVLYNLESIGEHYDNKKSLRETIRRLDTKKDLVETVGKDGRSNVYGLTDKGKKELEKFVKRENRELSDGELEPYDKTNAKELFIEFFENRAEDQLYRAESGAKEVTIDLEELAKFDAELEEDLRGNYEEVIESCEAALVEFPNVDNDVSVRLTNPFDHDVKEIRDLSPEKNLNEIVVVEGVLEATTEPQAELIRGIFECTQCGSRYSKEQDGKKLKSPYKCDCGNKKFETVEEIYDDVVLGRLKDKPSKSSKKKIPVKIQGRLTRSGKDILEATGQGVRVIGQLDIYKKKKNSDYFKIQLVANNIELEDDKWSDIKISDSDLEKIEEFREERSLVEVKNGLRDSIGKEKIAHAEKLKEAFLVWFLGRDTDSNLHVLVIGEPELGKSRLANLIEEEFPRVIKSLGPSSSGVGLTATARKDELTGEWVAEAGAIPQANNGFHITDEVDKAKDEDLTKLNEALSDKKITISKANIHTSIPADVSEFALGNPQDKIFDKYDEIYEQLPIDNEDLLSRFDLKLALKREDLKKDRQKEEDILDRILGRESENQDLDKDLLDKELLVKYFSKAQEIEPELSKEIEERLKEIYFNFRELEESKQNEEQRNLFGLRRFNTLRKLAKAYARLDFSEEVKEEHLELASSFFKECYESLDFQLGEDSFDEIKSDSKRRFSKLKDYIDSEYSKEDSIDVQDLVEESKDSLNLKEDEVEAILDQLKHEGELFEPEQGKIQRA